MKYLLLFLCLGCGQVCVGVHDGDTIYLKNKQTIRLYGIDCPELGQPYGEQAKAFTASLVLNKPIRVDNKGVDKYGRHVAIIYVEGSCINWQLLNAGLAWYDYYNCPALWKQETLLAKKNKRGLWNDSNVIAPYKCRKKWQHIN